MTRLRTLAARFRTWHDGIERDCDRAIFDLCLIALWAGIAAVMMILALESVGVGVVEHLPGRVL